MSSSWGAQNIIKDLTYIGEIDFTKKLISEYLSHADMKKIKHAVSLHGFYFANAESIDHQNIAFEILKNKLKVVLSGKVEKRKNSWANRLCFNLIHGNSKVVASQIASFWRRTLIKTSLKKAKRSQYGYEINGQQRSKTRNKKEIEALCGWCSKTIIAPLNKGFTCPHCGVYFQNFKPNEAKINCTIRELSYEENYDELTTIERIRRGEWDVKKAKFSRALQLTMM